MVNEHDCMYQHHKKYRGKHTTNGNQGVKSKVFCGVFLTTFEESKKGEEGGHPSNWLRLCRILRTVFLGV